MSEATVSERDRVAAWNERRLRELAGDEAAVWFVVHAIDPHDLEPLLNRGCPLELAKQILHPA